jgi:hypothetical protein
MRFDAQIAQPLLEQLFLHPQPCDLHCELGGIRSVTFRAFEFAAGFAQRVRHRPQLCACLRHIEKQRAHLVGDDVSGGDRLIAFEAHQRADQRTDDDHHQNAWQFRHDPVHRDQRNEGTEPESDSRPVRESELAQHADEIGQERTGIRLGDVEKGIQQGQTDDQRCGIREADHHRVRHEVHDDAEAEQAQEQPHQSHHQREQDGKLDEVLSARNGKRRERRRGKQR